MFKKIVVKFTLSYYQNDDDDEYDNLFNEKFDEEFFNYYEQQSIPIVENALYYMFDTYENNNKTIYYKFLDQEYDDDEKDYYLYYEIYYKRLTKSEILDSIIDIIENGPDTYMESIDPSVDFCLENKNGESKCATIHLTNAEII
jgi:hypothetical protein